MKNVHVKLTEECPQELKKGLYELVLDQVTRRQEFNIPRGRGLCLMLPMALWGIEYVMDLAPNGEAWRWEDTPKCFVELQGYNLDLIYDDEDRKVVLRDILSKL